VVIPDTQVRPGVDVSHLAWIGRYIVDKFTGRDVAIIHLGDHWDMPSLSSYDKGKKCMENRRVLEDIKAGNRGFKILNDALEAYNKDRADPWWPERHFLMGNHENRLARVGEIDPQLDGILPKIDLRGWTAHEFLKPVFIDGVAYAHYFYQPLTGKPLSGLIENRIRHIGHSFTMGHQQTLMYGTRFVAGRSQHGLVAGACYLHDEDYKGPQGNAHWRGIVVCHDVREGSYDPMFVSLSYLHARYS